jgi:hypothetical protein
MPLVVRPNTRRMRAFIDSPAERPGALRGSRARQLRWERLLLAAGVVGVIAVVILALQ